MCEIIGYILKTQHINIKCYFIIYFIGYHFDFTFLLQFVFYVLLLNFPNDTFISCNLFFL